MKRSWVDWDTGRRPRKVWRRSIQRRYNPVAESNVYGALMSLIEGKKLTEQAGNLCLLTVGQVSRRTAAEQKDRLRALQLISKPLLSHIFSTRVALIHHRIGEVADVPEDITLETIHLKLKQAADTAQIQNDQEDLERKPGTTWRSDNDHFRQLAQ